MQLTERTTALVSGIAMSASMWAASLLWFLSIDTLNLPNFLMPLDWTCFASGLQTSQLLFFVLFSGLVLFGFGWIWGYGLHRRHVNGGLVIGSALMLGLSVPIVFCNSTFGLRNAFFTLLILGFVIAIVVIAGQIKINHA